MGFQHGLREVGIFLIIFRAVGGNFLFPLAVRIEVFRILLLFLPVWDLLSLVCWLWRNLAAHRALSGILRLWRSLMLCRSQRRLLWRPHRLLLPVRNCAPVGLETAVVADSAVQAAAVVPLQPVTAAGAVAAQSVLPSVEQAALVHRLFLLLHHFVNLLLVLRLGIRTCLSERGDGLLMVPCGNQLAGFLEILLVLLPLSLSSFVSLLFCSLADLLSAAAFSACASNCAMLVISPVAFCTGRATACRNPASSSWGSPLRASDDVVLGFVFQPV